MFRAFSAWLRVPVRAALSCVVALCAGLCAWCYAQVAAVPLPAPLGTEDASLWLLDRSGRELARVRSEDGELREPVRLDELTPWLVPALLAAEDARFFQHPGVDPLAVLRALGQALRHGRVVSGASTVTQQLARQLFERPRGWLGKAQEAALALRLEAALDKNQILEAYFNRVDFGPRIGGVQAASRYYFDKPASALGLGEAAALAALVQGPSRYDPRRHPERLRARRDQILARLLERGWAGRESVEQARRAELVLHQTYVAPGAFHFVRALARGSLVPGLPSTGVVRSTLDAVLQQEVEAAVQGFATRFGEHRASAAAVLVVDNASAAVRAYVGSPDYGASRALGQNDGALGLRQPGSLLKPFVYALGMQELGLHAASLLPDLERRFVSGDGSYRPQNYDRRFHGPVRLAPALAASLNVPAATLADRLGPEHVAELLRQLGFSHLDDSAQKYGPAIALGVAEVQLVELGAAYATLARGGSYLPLRYLEAQPPAEPRRVLPAQISRQITEILSDPQERAATFGREGPLEFDFPVAVKTGTSKGNRDNWAVGYTPQRTVAVWVGNFDGSPMLHSSGATGAGPLLHAVMLAALRDAVPGRQLELASSGRTRVICALSGQLARPECPDQLKTTFWTEELPRETCSWHAETEALPDRYAGWAHQSGRSKPAPARAAPSPASAGQPRLAYPTATSRFVLDENLDPQQQEIVLSAQGPAAQTLAFEVDGSVVCRVGVPFQCPWRLRRGAHSARVVAASGAGESVRFYVD